MASFFKTLSDDMERVVQVFEQGYQIITGAATHMGEASGATANNNNDDGDFNVDEVLDGNEDINLEDIEEYGSPLMGMADSVMSNIMSYQVRHLWMIDQMTFKWVAFVPPHFLYSSNSYTTPLFISGRATNTNGTNTGIQICNHLE